MEPSLASHGQKQSTQAGCEPSDRGTNIIEGICVYGEKKNISLYHISH